MPKAKKLNALASVGMEDTLANTRSALTGGPSGIPDENTLASPGVDNLTQFNHNKAISDAAIPTDYLGAMYREDGFIANGYDRLIGHTRFNADPTWHPMDDANWKDLSLGVPEEYKAEYQKTIMDSLSKDHAEYLKGLVMNKAKDEELLGTMGRTGQAARFAYGLVSPEQVALGLATFGVSKAASIGRGIASVAEAGSMARSASKIIDPALRTAQLERAAAAMGEAAKAGSGVRGAATGLGTAAVIGGGFEKLRQSVGFEDNDNAVLGATLSSVAFAAPFVGLGVHQMNRLTRTAAMEKDVLGTMTKLHNGETLSEHEYTQLKDYGYTLQQVKHEEAGGLGDAPGHETLREKTDVLDQGHGPQEPLAPPKVDDGVNLPEDHTVPPSDAPTPPVETPPESPLIGETPPPESPPTTFDHPGTERPTDAPPATQRGDIVNTGFDPKDGIKPGLKGNAWADRLVSMIKTGKAKQVEPRKVLGTLRKRFDGTAYAPIIDALLKVPELNTKSHLSTDGISGKKYGGLYLSHLDTMVTYVKDLNKLSDREAQTFIHELVHAHTVHALDGKLDHVLSASQKAAVQGLKDLHKTVEKQLKKQLGLKKEGGFYRGEHYGLTNVKEFVSEALANKQFQKTLSEVKVGNGSAMSTLWNNIKKVMGFGKEMDDSAFARAIGFAEHILDSRIHDVGVEPLHPSPAELGGPVGKLNAALPASPAIPSGPSIMGFAEIGGKRVPIRWDISQVLDNNLNPHIKQLGYELVKNAIGFEGDKAQGITVSERKERIRRAVAGKAHFVMRDAIGEAMKTRQMTAWKRWTTKFDEEFYSNVTKVARGDTEVLTQNPDIASSLQKAAGAVREFYDTMGNRAINAGLEGAENLPVGKSYVNRVYRQTKITAMAKEHGPEAVWSLFANAFKNPKIKGDVAVGKKFVEAIQSLQYKTNMSDILLEAHDLPNLRKSLETHGLSSDKIDSIIDVMFDQRDTGDAGKPGNLKYRMDLDETAGVTLPSGVKLNIADVLENDPRILIDKYTNTMGGHVAMAEHGWTNPKAALSERLGKADDWVSNNSTGYDMSQYQADKTLVQDMFNHITGVPMSTQTFSRFDRTMGAMRAYSRSVFLGQLGVAAAFELKNAMAMSAYHGALSQMPTFSRVIDMLRKGIPVDDELAKGIQHIAGFGNEMAMSYGRQHEITDHSYDRGLTMFEGFSERASHLVDTVSGNSTITSATRNLAAKMVSQHLYDIAAGKKTMDEGFTKRLINNGIDKENIPATLADLNKHSIADAKGVLQTVDWEHWQQTSPKTYDDFTLAMERFTRDGIQDHNIGETMPWMHTTHGKIIAELKTFSLVAHSKQFLKNVHYHDRTAAMIFMTSFVGEALAYSVQSSLNYAHDPDKLAKRLSADRIAKAAVMRMSSLGALSYVIDTPAKFVTGKSFFGEGSNNTDNRDLLMTPSMMLMKRMVGSTQVAAQALSPFSNTVTTKQEVKDGLGVLPGSNTWGARNIVDFVSEHYPKSDPSQYQR